ncbi:MAG: hypothetical protein CMO69_01080 [Verrucomicrobiales bacterium]|nr:hypothetical protein [Verrucomicrobiales bacterium]
MLRFQEYINSIEAGKAATLIRYAVLLLMLVGASLVYNINFTRNFTAPEAMDSAQLARNIAEGYGFKTQFIRPVAIDMLRQTGNLTEEELKKSFPDITHPPLYPLLLGSWMKLMPFKFEIDLNNSEPKRYQPEVLIYLFNQILFFLALLQLFRLGKKLFDSLVAWCSSLVFMGSELYWQFSASGLSTMLLLVLFLALMKALVRFEEMAILQSAEGTRMKFSSRFFCMTCWIGALVGLGCMTRYGFGLLVIPIVVFIAWFGGGVRWRSIFFTLLTFIIVISPWLGRNIYLSGNLFGTSGLALYSQTYEFPEDTIERTLFFEPNELAEDEARSSGVTVLKQGVADRVGFWSIVDKLSRNMRHLLLTDLPRFSGGWFAVICLIGLVVPFRNKRLHRLRVFVLLSLFILTIGQALGRTHLSNAETTLTELIRRPLGQFGLAELAPNLSGDNLIVIIGPVSFLFGLGLFFSLLDQWKVDLPEMRLAGGSLIVLASSLPLLLSFILPKPYLVADPPYHPARIQYLKSIPKEHGLRELKPEDLLMSDLPWAVAWYGNQDSVWLTRSVQPDFYQINDGFRPVRALYFTEMTTDQRYVSRVFASNMSNWERFVLAIQLNKYLPDGFPLLGVEDAFSPRQWLLFDVSNGDK